MIYFKRNRLNEKKRWHKWFAWYPITIDTTPDGDKKKVWLSYVRRCFYPYKHYAGRGCYGTAYAKEYKGLKTK